MSRSSAGNAAAAHDAVERVLDPLDDGTAASIIALSPTLQEFAWAAPWIAAEIEVLSRRH